MQYSGTLGAVFEAATYGIPAVALSTTVDGFDAALEALDEIKDFFIRHELMKKNSLYNVNIPIQNKGIRMTRMGDRYCINDFLPQGNDIYMPTYQNVWKDSGDYTIDPHAALAGYVSITPLVLNRTNMAVFEELNELNF
jgi:5'/3'-nucleotidase SurE